MAKETNKPKEINKRLLNKYRLIILKEDTFEERFSLNINRLNVFVLISVTSLILITFTIFLIAYTPLKEYIPGYSSTELKKKALELNFTTDSLNHVMALNDRYYESIQKVLQGQVDQIEFNRDSIVAAAAIDSVFTDVVKPVKEDSLLREKVANEDKYNFFDTAKKATFVLFPPVSGRVVEKYDANKQRYGIRINVKKNTPVKAASDGTVIFAEWTSQSGFVIILEHPNALLSVYKHNESLSKSQGQMVKAGEVIATAGNTGQSTDEISLHFELWNDGYPVDPQNFVDFK